MKLRITSISVSIFLCCFLTACKPSIVDNPVIQPEITISETDVSQSATPAVETVTICQAVENIVSLLDGVDRGQNAADYAQEHGLLLMLNEQEQDSTISFRDAAVLLYEALSRGAHGFALETVSKQSNVDGLAQEDAAGRDLMFLYRWGILYGEPPKDWYAPISKHAFDEMLTRLQAPDLRAELIPDIPEQIASKLDEAYLCACVQSCEETALLAAKAGFQSLLLEQPEISDLLHRSYWFLEQDTGGTFYLTAFTQMENNQLSYSRYAYRPETAEGQVSAGQILDLYDWSAERILFAVCMDDAQKETLISTDLEEYAKFLQDNSEKPSYLEYPVLAAWAIPRQGKPALMLIGLRGETLISATLFNREGVNYVCDQLADSWYHIYD